MKINDENPKGIKSITNDTLDKYMSTVGIFVIVVFVLFTINSVLVGIGMNYPSDNKCANQCCHEQIYLTPIQTLVGYITSLTGFILFIGGFIYSVIALEIRYRRKEKHKELKND